MRFSIDDTRRYPHDRSWALGVWYHGLDEGSSIDVGLGYRTLGCAWFPARRPPALTTRDRVLRMLGETTYGFGIDRDPDHIWALWFGPWMWAIA